MDKVKLPKEVAEAIESLREPFNSFSDYAIIGMLYSPSKHKEVKEIQVLHENMGQEKMHPGDLLQALVNGYEVEETPEEKVREMYGIATAIERNAIVSTLNAVKISIEGVNT